MFIKLTLKLFTLSILLSFTKKHTYAQSNPIELAFEIDNIDYWGGTVTNLETFDITPNLDIIAFGWKDLKIETFDNRPLGAPIWNRGRDLIVGFSSLNSWLEDITWASPFIQGGFGNFGATSVEYDLSNSGYKTPENGYIELFASSTFDDMTGFAAGKLISGTLYVITAPVPAPSAILLPIIYLIGFKVRRP